MASWAAQSLSIQGPRTLIPPSTFSILQREEAKLVVELHLLHQQIEPRHIRLARLINRQAPVSRLGNNLVAKIFTMAAQLNANDADRLPFMAIYISHVCSSWRSLVLSLPDLWSSIFIIPSTPMQYLAAYSSRSGNRLVEVSYINMTDKAHPQRLLEYAFRLLSRCRVLDIFTRNAKILLPVLAELRRNPAPFIERVHIAYLPPSPYHTHRLGKRCRRLFADIAPKLSILDLDGLALQYCCPPLANLKRVSLKMTADQRFDHRAHRSALTSLLRTATQLEDLTLRDLRLSDSNIDVCRPSSARLKHLHLFPIPANLHANWDFTFIHFRLDLLEKLVLRDKVWKGIAEQIESAVLTPCLPNLRYLSLISCYDSDGFPLLAQCSPFLEHLSLSGVYMSYNLGWLSGVGWSGLDTKNCLPPVWPKLRILTLDRQDDPAHLHRFLSRRQESGRPLAKVRLFTTAEHPAWKSCGRYLTDRLYFCKHDSDPWYIVN